MDLITVVAGVLLGNLITVALIWNIRQLGGPNPPIRNLLAVIFIGLVVATIGIVLGQSSPAELSALHP
jgi:hypothetical protein